jgi:hypothetical protein
MQFNILSQLHEIVKRFLKKSEIFQKFLISALKHHGKMQILRRTLARAEKHLHHLL